MFLALAFVSSDVSCNCKITTRISKDLDGGNMIDATLGHLSINHTFTRITIGYICDENVNKHLVNERIYFRC